MQQCNYLHSHTPAIITQYITWPGNVMSANLRQVSLLYICQYLYTLFPTILYHNLLYPPGVKWLSSFFFIPSSG